jgi:A-kinase anchor protein 2
MLRQCHVLEDVSTESASEKDASETLHVPHLQTISFFNVRLEKEIQDLEKAELQISANEEAILKKLKSIEKTTEDIIRVSVTQLQTMIPSEESANTTLQNSSK